MKTQKNLAVQKALEEERAKNAEEKKVEDDQKMKLLSQCSIAYVKIRIKKKMRHRAMLWLMVSPILYQKEFQKKWENKKKLFNEVVSDNLGQNLEVIFSKRFM